MPKSATLAAAAEQGVTAAIITHNGRGVIAECLASLLRQTVPPIRILVISNLSTDGTPEWIREHYPQIEVVEYPVNNGPNPARNEAIRRSATELVLLIDDDAILDPDCILELLAARQRFLDAAVWAPRIVYHDRPNIIQYQGGGVHFLLESSPLSRDVDVTLGVRDITVVQAADGVSYLLSKSKAIAVGMYNEEMFFGRTDGEFTFRLTIAGQAVYTVPRALCYHRAKMRGTAKIYYQARNRWYILLSCYSWRTIILIIPALAVYEVSLFVFLLLKGAALDYLRANLHVLQKLPRIMRRRSMIQRTKAVPDRLVLSADPMYMRRDLLANPMLRPMKWLLDAFFTTYWKLIRRFV